MFTTFDGSSGEVCQIRRIRTNTPLQALVTMNDPVFLEAAAALADWMIADAETAEERSKIGFERAMARPPRVAEITALVRLQHDAEVAFEQEPTRARQLIESLYQPHYAASAEASSEASTESTVGTAGPESERALVARAAWIVTANAILNLDEFLSRQ
jgi:hypothetical protein